MNTKMKHPGHSYIVLTLVFQQDETDGRWSAVCKELGTATDGDSLEETRQAILSLIGLYLNTIEEMGDRDRIFRANGIKLLSSPPEQPITRRITFDSPRVLTQLHVHDLAGV